MTAPPPGWLDRAAARRAVARAARHGPFRDPLAEEIGKRMAERLEYVKLDPARVLEVRCRPGQRADSLHSRYPRAERVALDRVPQPPGARAPARWLARLGRAVRGAPDRTVCAELERLPFRAARFGLVWSNFALAASDDPAAVLREWQRVLEPEGLVMFSTLGPDTLKDLRAAFGSDASPHVHPFVDMHDIGDMLVAAGFADPVIDMELMTLTYPTLEALLDDLRRSGATNALAMRRRGLTGRALWERVRRAYAGRTRDGRLPATFEVVYGHAWKPQPRATEDGRRIIRFDAGAPRRMRG